MMSLRKTLTLLIVSGIGAASLLTALALWSAERGRSAAEQAFVAKDVTADILPPPMYLIELRLVLSQALEGTLPVAKAQGEWGRLKREYEERVAYWQASPPHGLEKQLLGAQHAAAGPFIRLAGELLGTLASGDAAGAGAQLKQADQLYLAHRAGVDRTVAASMAFAEASMTHFGSTQQRGGTLALLVFAVAVLLLVGFGRWAQRSVWAATGGEPADVADIANAVARGDLTVRVPVREGDSGSVMAAMDRMCRHLIELVGQVRASSDSIATGSAQIASGNGDLSQRTERQAARLQETALAMNQLSNTVRDTAEHAMEASRRSAAAMEMAEQGGTAVSQVVTTMGAITESSRRIADITSVIDSLSFQTNILALNAAVEAARAGEQGRGFAVVAGDVRSLAQRSAQAAREIKSVLGESAGMANSGVQLAQHATATMNEIVSRVRQVTELISVIGEAAVEQRSGIGEVGKAVVELDRSTQENAALVEESAAAADSLKQQADRLVAAVVRFNLPAAA